MFLAARKYMPSKAAVREAAAISDAALRDYATRGDAAFREAAARGKALLPERVVIPHFEKPDTTTVALLGTTFNLLNATTGPGLLALPLAFARCGYVLGSVLLTITFALNHMALSFLLKSCLQTREHSYIGLALRHSPELAALVDYSSLAFFFGSCVSYLVIIGDTFDQFTAAIGGTGPWYVGGELMHFSILGLLMLVVFTVVCLTPLSLLRSMDSLAVTSGVAMICILYAVGVIAIAPGAPMAAADHSTPAVPSTSPRAIVLSSQTLLSLPTMAFCFASQPLFPPALESLHQPATYDFMHNVVNVTMALTFVLHLLVALGGYLRYGASVPANVLDALPPGPVVAVARGAIVLAFAFTYPMMIFLCRMHIRSILSRTAASKSRVAREEAMASHDRVEAGGGEENHELISLLLVGGTLLTAILFPDIDALFGILGGTTAVVIAFIAPALFWERFVGFMLPQRHSRRLLARLLIAFAGLVAALSLPSMLVDLLGDLYATAWWVPVSTSAGLGTWSGGIAAENAAAAVDVQRTRTGASNPLPVITSAAVAMLNQSSAAFVPAAATAGKVQRTDGTHSAPHRPQVPNRAVPPAARHHRPPPPPPTSSHRWSVATKERDAKGKDNRTHAPAPGRRRLHEE